MLLLLSSSFATVTVTGHVKIGDTTTPGANVVRVRFELIRCTVAGQNTPRVIGVANFKPLFDVTTFDGTGAFSVTTYGNDVITCDQAGNSRWKVTQIFSDGTSQFNVYQFTDGVAANLDSLSVDNSAAITYQPNAVITNPSGDQTVTQPGSTNLNINRLNVTTCTGCGGTPPVTSVFGRTGTVVSALNDYNFNQLAGASTKAQSPATDVYTDQANTYTAGMKQVFGASATTAGEGFGGVSADPSGAVAGDRWYRTDLNCMRIFTSAAHCVMFSDGPIVIGQTPLTTRGDLMTVNSGGALSRLAIGGANGVLHGGADPAYSAVAIGDVTGSSGTGNFLFATSPSMTNATVNQAADGNNLFFGQRFTDSSPTGNLIYFKNAANNADLFKLDVAGVATHWNNLIFGTDNAFDIGASGATRPRTLYFGTQTVGPNGSCTTPTYGFSGSSNTGIAFAAGGTSLLFCSNGSQVADIQVSGGNRFQLALNSHLDLNGISTFIATAPTISTHFNTSGDSITAANTAGFKIVVGTGTAGSTGAITLPAATNGWECWLTNQTRAAVIQETANSTTSATFTNYGTTPGTPVNWTNSDILVGGCTSF